MPGGRDFSLLGAAPLGNPLVPFEELMEYSDFICANISPSLALAHNTASPSLPFPLSPRSSPQCPEKDPCEGSIR